MTLQQIAKIPSWVVRYRAWRDYQRANGATIDRKSFDIWDQGNK